MLSFAEFILHATVDRISERSMSCNHKSRVPNAKRVTSLALQGGEGGIDICLGIGPASEGLKLDPV